jgi:hypothetical protein
MPGTLEIILIVIFLAFTVFVGYGVYWIIKQFKK